MVPSRDASRRRAAPRLLVALARVPALLPGHLRLSVPRAVPLVPRNRRPADRPRPLAPGRGSGPRGTHRRADRRSGGTQARPAARPRLFRRFRAVPGLRAGAPGDRARSAGLGARRLDGAARDAGRRRGLPPARSPRPCLRAPLLGNERRHRLLGVDRRRARGTDLARALRGRRVDDGPLRSARRVPGAGVAAPARLRRTRRGLDRLGGRSPSPGIPRHALRLHDRVLAVPVRPSPRRGGQRLRDTGVWPPHGAQLRRRVRHATVHRALVAIDRGILLAIASICVGLGFGAYALSSNMPQFYAATLVWTVGDVVGLPLVSAVVASMSPADLRGRYQGAQMLAQALAMVAAPLVAGAG